MLRYCAPAVLHFELSDKWKTHTKKRHVPLFPVRFPQIPQIFHMGFCGCLISGTDRIPENPRISAGLRFSSIYLIIGLDRENSCFSAGSGASLENQKAAARIRWYPAAALIDTFSLGVRLWGVCPFVLPSPQIRGYAPVCSPFRGNASRSSLACGGSSPATRAVPFCRCATFPPHRGGIFPHPVASF